MRVNTKQAVRLFFQNPSLIQVFKEAIANSLDANATQIKVNIFIDSFDKQETLEIEITDNGEGYTDSRYKKFCELLKVEENTHQGVGRLVYLSYFNTVKVQSYFGGNYRSFTFDDNFDEDNTDMSLSIVSEEKQETKLIFSDCSMKRLSSYSDIMPEYLRQEILKEFCVKPEEGEYFELLKKNTAAILSGIIAGAVTSFITVLVLSVLFRFSHKEYVTFLPKSITTAIGMGISEELGGFVPITVAVIIITGIFGNVISSAVFKLFRINEPVAKGVSLGTASHAIGTAKAMELGEVEGAMSSLSIVICGIFTVFGFMLFEKIY